MIPDSGRNLEIELGDFYPERYIVYQISSNFAAKKASHNFIDKNPAGLIF
jgi:hypothetical protein